MSRTISTNLASREPKGASLKLPAAIVLVGALLGLSPAHAETQDITFKNTGPTAIALTVVDMAAKKPVISGQQIVRRGGTVHGPVTFDSKGRGHIKYKISQATVHDKAEDALSCQPVDKSEEIGKGTYEVKLTTCKKK